MGSTGRKIKRNLAVGVDAGATKTRCVITEKTSSGLLYLASAEVDSRGWVKGDIVSEEAVAKSISKTIRMASRLAHVRVKEAVFGIGGWYVSTANESATMQLEQHRHANDADVLQIEKEIAKKQALSGRGMVTVVRSRWFEDSVEVRSPFEAECFGVGMAASIITAPLGSLKKLHKAIRLAGLTVQGMDFEAHAAGRAALTEQERIDGVLVVDIGTQSAGLALWQKLYVAFAAGLFIGGDQMTRDTAFALEMPVAELRSLREALTEKDETSEDKRATATVRLAMGESAKELARGVKIALADHGFGRRDIPDQIVLVGGGAMYGGMIEAFTQVFKCPTRLGLPPKILGFPKRTTEGMTDWCTAFGLAMRSAVGHRFAGGGEQDRIRVSEGRPQHSGLSQ